MIADFGDPRFWRWLERGGPPELCDKLRAASALQNRFARERARTAQQRG